MNPANSDEVRMGSKTLVSEEISSANRCASRSAWCGDEREFHLAARQAGDIAAPDRSAAIYVAPHE